MRPRRPVFLALAAASVVTLIFSGWALANRIERWNETNGRPIYYFFSVDTTLFTFAGKPVEVRDELNDEGEGEVIVEYGDDTLRIPVTIPNELPLPGLARHSEWLKFHAFAQGERGQTFDEFQAARERGEIDTRLVAVVRTPFGADAKEGRSQHREVRGLGG